MSTILMINGPVSGHVYPTLGLVEELIEEGDTVVYVSSEEYRTKLERTGAVFYAYDNFLLEGDPFQFDSYLPRVLKILSSYEIILPTVLELAAQYSFDYLIHDSMYGCGRVVAELLGLPHIAICTSFIDIETIPVQPEGEKRSPATREDLLLMREFVSLSERIRHRFGIRSRLGIHEVFFNEGMLNLVLTSESFQPPYDRADICCKFVGNLLSNRHESPVFPIGRIRDRRTVYISMGTIYNDVEPLYRLCFKAFASFDGMVVLSTGNRVNAFSWQDIPANFIVLPYVSQLELLPHVDLFITHGGMNSVQEALRHGIPLVVIPLAADQPAVARRVQELGAGMKLERSALTPEQLRLVAEEVLENGLFRMNSAKLGESLRSAGGRKQALAEIRSFKRKHNL